MKKVVLHLTIVFFIIFLTFLPLISSFVAGGIASWNDCRLHEGFPNPCIIGGVDVGEWLYAMAVAGWFMLVTLPIGICLMLIYLAVVIALALRRPKVIKKETPVD